MQNSRFITLNSAQNGIYNSNVKGDLNNLQSAPSSSQLCGQPGFYVHRRNGISDDFHTSDSRFRFQISGNGKATYENLFIIPFRCQYRAMSNQGYARVGSPSSFSIFVFYSV